MFTGDLPRLPTGKMKKHLILDQLQITAWSGQVAAPGLSGDATSLDVKHRSVWAIRYLNEYGGE